MKQILFFILLSIVSFSSLLAHGQEYLIVVTYAFWLISPLAFLITAFILNWRLVKKYGGNEGIDLRLWKLNLYSLGLVFLSAVICTVLHLKHIIDEPQVAWLLFVIPAAVYGGIGFLTLKSFSPNR